jgi:asparagine synthase (glutamine-hydrolysing)
VCGIVGLVDCRADASTVNSALRDMSAAIVHRGPDSAGSAVAGHLGIAMRRLKIIDLTGGDQPISSENGDISVVFNGEIYNFQSLRRQLVARGHRFGTQSDTEVIVHLFEEHGPGCVEHLRGMFAIAVWDRAEQSITLMRDRFGIKPLFIAEAAGRLGFASEIASLLTLPWVDRSWNADGLAAYLRLGYVPWPHTAFNGIRKMAPGSVETWKVDAEGRPSRLAVERYWTPETGTAECSAVPPRSQAIEAVRELLLESVRMRLVADVPLGAFLSGGVDSSVVVALMARCGVEQLKTFSIGFGESRFDEQAYARQVAERVGSDHRSRVVSGEDAAAVAPQILARFGEPFADSSAIPTYFVSQVAREHVTVALSGDGGDELFSGYPYYRQLQDCYRPLLRLPRFARRSLSRGAARLVPRRSRGGGFVRRIGGDPHSAFLNIVAEPVERLVEEAFVGRLREFLRDSRVSDWEERFLCEPTAHGAQIVDQSNYLTDDILTKVDRCSMAVSLEARVPLLDHKVAEYANALPAHFNLVQGRSKAVLRESVADLIPPEFFDRPKQGFAIPLRSWLMRELRPLRFHATGAGSGLFDERGMRSLTTAFETAGWDMSFSMWKMVALGEWASANAAGRPW